MGKEGFFYFVIGQIVQGVLQLVKGIDEYNLFKICILLLDKCLNL